MHRRTFLLAIGASALVSPTAHAASPSSTIIVDFDFKEVQYQGGGVSRIYPAVLPKPIALQSMQLERRPVHGELSQIDYKPAWMPTPDMRRANPRLPKVVRYGEPLHPIGIYRLRVNWQNPTKPDFWQYVRIHGGAKEADLYGHYSSGCVRMRDADITEMVALLQRAGDKTRITFGYGLAVTSERLS